MTFGPYTAQVFSHGETRTRFVVWIADLLPHKLAARTGKLMEHMS